MSAIHLRTGKIEYDTALRDENDIIHRVADDRRLQQLEEHLKSQVHNLQQLVAFHLRLDRTHCIISPKWICGNFNVCIPVEIPSLQKSFLIRCPMVHKFQGSVDEKIRCEVATYIYIQEKCPEISIPYLVGFGLKDGSHVRG
jgi:hypothetical protein